MAKGGGSASSGGGANGGCLGGRGGSVAAIAAGGIEVRGGSLGVGIDGGSRGAATVSGLARFDQGPAFGMVSFGLKPLGSPGGINGFSEYGNLADFKANGPAAFGLEAQALSVPVSIDVKGSISFLKNTAPLYQRRVDSVVRAAIKDEQSISNQAAKKLRPLLSALKPTKAPKREAALPILEKHIYNLPSNHQEAEVYKLATKTTTMPKVESTVEAIVALGAAAEPEIKNALATQTYLEEEKAEEAVKEQIVRKKSDITEEEEPKESNLKDVVDEEVLNARLVEFEGYVEKAGLKVKSEALKKGQHEEDKDFEIDGERIVSIVSAETADKRSGLVKQKGPDGSRLETIQEIKGKKFKSVIEAKDKTMAIIFRKVPVKKAREGKEVGKKDVARVLRHLFIKDPPQEQTAVKLVKKRQLQREDTDLVAQETFVPDKLLVKSTEPQIEDYPELAEVVMPAKQVLQKAA